MTHKERVAVTSRSFSKHPVLRAELLAQYPNTKFNDAGLSLNGDALVEFLQGIEKAITALERIDESILSRLPNLKVIGKYGVGTDMIDQSALAKYGVRLGWTGGVNRKSVAELAIAMMISLLRHLPYARDEVLAGRWRQIRGYELGQRRVGILGCGHVGKEVAILLKAFGCEVLAHDLLDFLEFYSQHKIRAVSFDELLAESDILTIHVPLDDSTRRMLGVEQLKRMKPGIMLINVARGGIVDEGAMKQMLQKKHIGGAAFDVFEVEPPEDMELLSLPSFMVSPHIGGSSEEAVLAMGRAAIDGLDHNEMP